MECSHLTLEYVFYGYRMKRKRSESYAKEVEFSNF